MENKYKKWTKKEEDGYKCTTIEVEQVENGYIKTVTVIDKSKDEYCCETKKYISKDNPLEEKPLIQKLEELFKNI